MSETRPGAEHVVTETAAEVIANAVGNVRHTSEIRRFELRRNFDSSGVSGTGVVAEGCEFTDGVVTIRWLGKRQSTVIHPGIDNVIAIHGHTGNTRIVWLD